MKYTASRVSDGNKLFPASIETEGTGLKVRLPGFWKDNETFLSYTDISGVSVNTPLIGYSTIEFNAMGMRVKAHGFSKSDVNEIKRAIDEGKKREPVISYNQNQFPTGANQSDSTTVVNKGDGFLAAGAKGFFGMANNMVQEDLKGMKENKAKEENKIEEVSTLTFGSTVDEISNQLSQLASFASTKPEQKIKNAIIEKMEFGIMKLRSLNANAEVDFFQKKLEQLKKKSWF